MTGLTPGITPFELYEPPFYGTGEVLSWNADALCNSIDADRLFKEYWGGASLADNAYNDARRADFEPALQRLVRVIISADLLEARGYYGFFPVITDGDAVIILDPSDFRTERALFRCTRTAGDVRPTLADLLRPEGDVLPIFALTLGAALEAWCGALPRDAQDPVRMNGIGAYLQAHLGLRLAVEIRRALFLAPGKGAVCSFGDPGMPPPAQQNAALDLMCAEDRLGISLVNESGLDPGFSAVCVLVCNSTTATTQEQS